MIILIPAFQPDMHLITLVQELRKETADPVIVVDDGSTGESKEVFELLPADVILLRHEHNRGKGRALKTGMAYVANHYPEDSGVVLADADGQHKAADIIRVGQEQAKCPDTLILGSRQFRGRIPWRSRVGNQITRTVFRLFSGKNLTDTQTGLRAFPVSLISLLLSLEGERYEYEMNMLLGCIEHGVRLKEVPIETIYEDNLNSTSHFKPVKDSARIYYCLLKFTGASLISFCADYAAFLLISLLMTLAGAGDWALSAAVSNIAARCISAVVNYILNRKFVYKSTDRVLTSGIRYAVLAAGILIVNTAVLQFFWGVLKIPKAAAKLLVEAILFLVSMALQKSFVFPNSHMASKQQSGK